MTSFKDVRGYLWKQSGALAVFKGLSRVRQDLANDVWSHVEVTPFKRDQITGAFARVLSSLAQAGGKGV